MSYDILLVPRRAGQSFDDALDAASDDAVPDPAQVRAQWARIETRARALLGDVHVHVDPDGGGAELSHDPTGLQVELFPGQAAVSYPYWEHEDRAAFHRLVAELVAVVAQETGFEAYDPQTGEAFDGTPDDGVGVAGTARIAAEHGGRPHGVPAAAVPPVPGGTRPHAPAGAAPVSSAPPARRGPRAPLTDGDQRARALRYLVCGAVVVLVAGAQLVGGGVTAWSVVLLLGGVLNVVVGAVVWRRWVARRP